MSSGNIIEGVDTSIIRFMKTVTPNTHYTKIGEEVINLLYDHLDKKILCVNKPDSFFGIYSILEVCDMFGHYVRIDFGFSNRKIKITYGIKGGDKTKFTGNVFCEIYSKKIKQKASCIIHLLELQIGTEKCVGARDIHRTLVDTIGNDTEVVMDHRITKVKGDTISTPLLSYSLQEKSVAVHKNQPFEFDNIFYTMYGEEKIKTPNIHYISFAQFASIELIEDKVKLPKSVRLKKVYGNFRD